MAMPRAHQALPPITNDLGDMTGPATPGLFSAPEVGMFGRGVGVVAVAIGLGLAVRASALTPIGPELIVNSEQAQTQRHPSIDVAPDGSFVVAWTAEGGIDGAGMGVFARWFAADGTPQTGD